MVLMMLFHFTLNVDVQNIKRLGQRAGLITQYSFSTCCWRWLQVVYKTVIDVDYDEEVLDTIMPSICYTPYCSRDRGSIGYERLFSPRQDLCLYVSHGNHTFKINPRDAIFLTPRQSPALQGRY